MNLLDEIKEKREELNRLEKQYLNETPACCNVKCGFYNSKYSGRCSWSILLEDCRDYKSEYENEK